MLKIKTFLRFLVPNFQYSENIRLFVGPGYVTNKLEVKANKTGENVGVTGNFNKMKY